MVTFACSFSMLIPRTTTDSIFGCSSVTIVPGLLFRLLLTSNFTPNFLANSTDLDCITLEPEEAISNISSYEISLIFLAFFTTLGSQVYTPSTSVSIWQRSASMAAAIAIAVRSDPPLPSVVIRPSGLLPWNPASMTI